MVGCASFDKEGPASRVLEGRKYALEFGQAGRDNALVMRNRGLPGVRGLLATLLLAIATPAGASSGTVPRGYFVDPKQLEADRPIDRVEAEGDFTLAIHRRYEGPAELKLLSIAEALYPPREVLIARSIERNLVMGSDSARVPCP